MTELPSKETKLVLDKVILDLWRDRYLREIVRENPFFSMMPIEKPLTTWQRFKSKLNLFKYRFSRAWTAFKMEDE